MPTCALVRLHRELRTTELVANPTYYLEGVLAYTMHRYLAPGSVGHRIYDLVLVTVVSRNP